MTFTSHKILHNYFTQNEKIINTTDLDKSNLEKKMNKKRQNYRKTSTIIRKFVFK